MGLGLGVSCDYFVVIVVKTILSCMYRAQGYSTITKIHFAYHLSYSPASRSLVLSPQMEMKVFWRQGAHVTDSGVIVLTTKTSSKTKNGTNNQKRTRLYSLRYKGV